MAPLPLPVLHFEPWHALELRPVQGDEGRAASARLGGDQRIVRADRGSLRLELSANFSCFARVFEVERRLIESGGKEKLEIRSRMRGPIALGAAILQFVAHDRRHN